MIPHAHRIPVWTGRLVVAILAAAICLMPSSAIVPAARAESATTAEGHVTISIDSATAVVTATSGYRIRATIANKDSTSQPAGTLTLATNALYTFVSRTDIQQWAQGAARIPTNNQLGTVSVPSLAPGGETSVSIDVPANSQELGTIASWGPKPVLLTYHAGEDGNAGTTVNTHTFLTRSSDGLMTAATPPLQLTVAMPLTSASLQTDDTTITDLLTDDTGTSSASSSTPKADASITAYPAENSKTVQAQERLLSSHAKLQAIADPSYLAEFSTLPNIAGLAQPAMFDITQYADQGNARSYDAAGVTTASWNAQAGQTIFRNAVGDHTNSPTSYAWHGTGRWTMESLTEAKRQGYSTVIADADFVGQSAATVHTGKYVIPTDAGDVTALVAQPELSNLAQGNPTSNAADSETSSAGRLLRFMAQSAFYQMERPYTSRNLLVCFGTTTSTADEDALMSALEQASWVSLTDLNTLSQETAYRSGAEAKEAVPTSSNDSTEQRQAVTSTLQSLAASRNDINRFATSVLAPYARNKRQTATSTPSESDDVQALARQDASNGKTDADAWISRIRQAHDLLALHALGDDSTLRDRMSAGAQKLASQLLDGVTITPSENVTVVSETASMPVTVSNDHPYPVHVRVSSLTDSMEIVTSRFSDADVPAHGEQQITFQIRVSTSGSTVANLTLQDRDGVSFSSPQATNITSSLQISDKSGIIIVVVAVILGLVGLWRQLHRRQSTSKQS